MSDVTGPRFRNWTVVFSYRNVCSIRHDLKGYVAMSLVWLKMKTFDGNEANLSIFPLKDFSDEATVSY